MTDMRKLLPLAAVLCLVATGCAKEASWNTGQKAKAYLDMYMAKYYPDIKPNEDGLYILAEEKGDGKPWHPDSAYVYATYTIRNLDGTISSTTEAKVAQQLGTYDSSNYYGPRYMAQGNGKSYSGLDMLLDGMQVGGYRKAVVPSWLLNTSRLSSLEDYLNACTTEAHLIYEVWLHGQTNDVLRTEIDSLETYVKRHYGVGREKSISYIQEAVEGTFYFFSDTTAFAGKHHFSRDTTLTINYTGYLLNGQAFDTTDEKIAKDNNIYYVTGKTYAPVSVTYSSTVSNIKMGSSSLISGFQGGLSQMVFVGQRAVCLFTSNLGYSSSGSGQGIPPYSPLIFVLEIVEDDEEE